MAEKRKGSNIVNTVWDLAEPFAKELSLEIWDVQFLKEGGNWYLRITIDKEGGVFIDDCVALHRAIDGPLDEIDPIDQSYNLQVSSAGIERNLVRDEHFLKYIGSDIKLKLQKGIDGQKEFEGVLSSYDSSLITLILPDGKELEIDKKACAWVRLDDFEGF